MHVIKKLKNLTKIAQITLLTSICGSSLACDDIAVVSTDARYIVLDAVTLREIDVGNFWWLGIREVDMVVKNSSVSNAAFWVNNWDPFVDSRPTAIESGATRIISLQNLGRENSWNFRPPEMIDAAAPKVWWVSQPNNQRLLKFENAEQQSRISVLDSNLAPLETFNASDLTMGFGVACEGVGGSILVAGLRDYFKIAETGFQTTEFPLPQDGTRYHLMDVTLNCLVTLGRFGPLNELSDPQSQTVEVAIVDMNKNQVVSRFLTRRFVRNVLTDNGNKMIQQDLAVQFVGENGDSIQLTPTNKFRVLDTRDGSIVSSREMPSSGRITSPYCSPDDPERVILYSDQTLYLIDATNLSTIATREIPFDEYFIF